MENNEKKRVTLSIGGATLAVVTDQDDEAVMSTAEDLDTRIRTIRNNNFTVSLTDAAILCALEDTAERRDAEKRIRSLEAQVALCEMSMRNMRDEIASLKRELSGEKDAERPSADGKEEDPQGIISSLGLSGSTPEERIGALERYLESKRLAGENDASDKESRIRYIGSLLRCAIDIDE